MKSEELQYMTKEELLKVIEELKEENTNLKSIKKSPRDTSRNVLPDELFKKFNGVRNSNYYKKSDLPFINHNDIVLISQVIRNICFPTERKYRKGYPNGFNGIKSLKSMNEKEYQNYTNVLNGILSVLNENAMNNTKEN